MTKTELILKQTCSTCQNLYQLIETYQGANCALDCKFQWKQTLHEYYQQQIILHLAQLEREKEAPDE